MGKLNEFLNRQIIQKDVGEETFLTWKETISYALGRGAQGMSTSMTSSKYINYFLTNVLFRKIPGEQALSIASNIRFFAGSLMRSTIPSWGFWWIAPARRTARCVPISNGPLGLCRL